jgi:hypothetical protein
MFKKGLTGVYLKVPDPLEILDSPMVENEAPVAVEEPKAISAEVEIYMSLLVLIFLVDQHQYDLVLTSPLASSPTHQSTGNRLLGWVGGRTQARELQHSHARSSSCEGVLLLLAQL